MVANLLLAMLDKSLIELERKHKTGSPYWKRLRVRKRLVQTLLYAAGIKDWKEIRQHLFEEFFWTADKELLARVKPIDKNVEKAIKKEALDTFAKVIGGENSLTFLSGILSVSTNQIEKLVDDTIKLCAKKWKE